MKRYKWTEEKLSELSKINDMKKETRFMYIKSFIEDEANEIIEDYERDLDKIYD